MQLAQDTERQCCLLKKRVHTDETQYALSLPSEPTGVLVQKQDKKQVDKFIYFVVQCTGQ